MDIYILYDADGAILNSGKINRECDNANRDGSTRLEWCEKQIESGAKITYLPNGDILPNKNTHKVVGGVVVPLTPADLKIIAQAEHQKKFYAAYKQYIESKISPDTQRRLQSLHASPGTNAAQKVALETGEAWVDTVEAHYIDNADTPFFEWDFSQFDATCPFTENKYHKIIKTIKAIK